ncbi:hypothetical protein HAX54_012461 [Datura stramonium]|uniref:Uncharacterized protein n=1 Tax=Datura stramonium TaxID=4076 RepID=A0ABS8Y552_DATST|nr:hypothetical protein [Datura stramonium]
MLDNFEHVRDERVLPAAVEKSLNKFDARVNVEMGLCVDESVKGRGVSLNGDMEVGDDLQVVSFASGNERNEREEENLKVASSLAGDTFVVALKSKRKKRKNKSSANDFELDVPISALK